MSPYLFLIFFLSTLSLRAPAGPVSQMNKAFLALMELVPFFHQEEEYRNKKNESAIKTQLSQLSQAFKSAGHDGLIKFDLFAPSYELINQNINQSYEAFKEGKKDYSLWMIKETLTLCLDCHSRLPTSVTSSFQNGELTVDQTKLKSPYDLGVTYLIVRRYVDAKQSFTRDIQDQIIKKDFSRVLLPLKQILLIETKIQRDPDAMISIIDDYLRKKVFPSTITTELEEWKKRLLTWKKNNDAKSLTQETEVKRFMKRRLTPLLEKEDLLNTHNVDLLMASGILSRYFFENHNTTLAPEMSLWLGKIEKKLKRDEFMSSGDLFLKQCILRYPKQTVAKECLKEYKESIEFEFTGSGGTFIPQEVAEELKKLENLVYPKP